MCSRFPFISLFAHRLPPSSFGPQQLPYKTFSLVNVFGLPLPSIAFCRADVSQLLQLLGKQQLILHQESGSNNNNKDMWQKITELLISPNIKQS